jgi:hypothetical protein
MHLADAFLAGGGLGGLSRLDALYGTETLRTLRRKHTEDVHDVTPWQTVVLNPRDPHTAASTRHTGGEFIESFAIPDLLPFLPSLLPRFRVPATPVVGQLPVGITRPFAAADS